MRPPAALIKKGIDSLPCIGDGRQSGTSGSPSILNASPEAAANGGLALLKTGDRVRIDLRKGTADILISKAELAKRRAALQKQRRLSLSGEPDALAGNPARHGRPARRRHGAQAGGEIPARGADQSAAPQPLGRPPCRPSPTSARPSAKLHRVRLLRHPQSLGRRQRALSAASRLQGDRLDQRRLRLRAGPSRRRGAARHDARASARARARLRPAAQCRFRGRLCRRSRGRRRERAARASRPASPACRSRTAPTASSIPSTTRWRALRAARARDRQGRRRRDAGRPRRMLPARPARPRRDHRAAQGLCQCRRRLPLCARHQEPRADRGGGRTRSRRSRSTC